MILIAPEYTTKTVSRQPRLPITNVHDHKCPRELSFSLPSSPLRRFILIDSIDAVHLDATQAATLHAWGKKGPENQSEPPVHLIGVSRQKEKELAGLDEIAREQPIEVDTAGETGSVEANFVIAGLLVSILENRNLLADGPMTVRLDGHAGAWSSSDEQIVDRLQAMARQTEFPRDTH